MNLPYGNLKTLKIVSENNLANAKVTPQEGNKSWGVEVIPYISIIIYTTVTPMANYILLYSSFWEFVNIAGLFRKFFCVRFNINIIKYSCTSCVSKNVWGVDIWNRICWTRDEEGPVDTFSDLVYNHGNGRW